MTKIQKAFEKWVRPAPTKPIMDRYDLEKRPLKERKRKGDYVNPETAAAQDGFYAGWKAAKADEKSTA